MNLQKATQPYVVLHDDEDGTHHVSLRVRMSAKDRKEALRHPYATAKLLEDAGLVEESGCKCSHCRRDWDCCGRLYPSYVSIEPAKRGIKVTQRYDRNL